MPGRRGGVVARPDATGLAGALRDGTSDAHEAAESEPFVRRLTAGELPIEAYPALVVQNHAIYSTLERLGERWRDDPIAGTFVVDELRRVPSLEADLAQLLGPDLAEEQRIEDATRRYTARLENVCGDWPAGYVAHHYVRYLGDLSGGQILKQAVEKAYPQAPTSFYTFEGIARIKPFRDRYRRMLDALPVGVADQRRMVAEAIVAFDLNRAVFADLAARYSPGAPVHWAGQRPGCGAAW